MVEIIIKKQRPRPYTREIAVRDIERPADSSIQKEIEWICECLGLADREDDIAVDIFKELLRTTREREGVTTREIVDKEKTSKKVTQGAVVYHLNIFMSNGIVIKQGRRYYLKSARLDEMIEEMEYEMLRRMRKMRELAKHIDEELEQAMREL